MQVVVKSRHDEEEPYFRSFQRLIPNFRIRLLQFLRMVSAGPGARVGNQVKNIRNDFFSDFVMGGTHDGNI